MSRPISANMPHDDLDLLRRNPAWLLTLQAYWNAHLEAKRQSKEFDGWMPRLTEISEVPAETLSGVHGKLIAFGYLKFELTPKDASLRYQLTPMGRTAVTGEACPEFVAEADAA